MAQGANIVKYVGIGFGRQTEAYGAWYEGQMGKNYYRTQAALTMRQKQEAIREADMQERQSHIFQSGARDVLQEAEYIRQSGEYAKAKHRMESDVTMTTAAGKMAKSGVDMSYGSPLEYLDYIANIRAQDLAVTGWKNDISVWEKKREAADIQEKATIMLDIANVNRANLSMYDYQAQLYAEAGQEAERAARWKEISAYVGAVNDVFGGSGGSFGGAGGGFGGSGGGTGGGGGA
jgi:uncharacterized membrane protein YgcG